MMVISEWVKRAAHTQIILHEKGFSKTKRSANMSEKQSQKTKSKLLKAVEYFLWNTLMKQQNIARNRQGSSCHYKISLCLI